MNIGPTPRRSRLAQQNRNVLIGQEAGWEVGTRRQAAWLISSIRARNPSTDQNKSQLHELSMTTQIGFSI